MPDPIPYTVPQTADDLPIASSDLRAAMQQYHDAINAQVDGTLADLQQRWAPVRATMDLEIQRLQQQMEAALAKGDTLTAGWLAEAQRLTALKSLVEGNVAQFAAAAQQDIGAAQLAAIRSGGQAAQETLQATVPPGVNYTFGVPPASVTAQFAGALQEGSPLAALFSTFGPEAADRAGQALFTSIALGENPRVAAQRLQWATDLPRQRAEVIARTEILRSWRSAQLANYRANSDVVQGWQWSCDFSPRSCSACIALDGTIHPLDEELDDHICGRCSALPLTGSWASILQDAGVSEADIPASLRAADAQASADARGMGRPTASEWLAQQPPEIQNQIMGPAKAEAWRQGAFQLRDLVGVRHDPQWGSSIQELSLKQMGLDAPTWLAKARAAGNGSMVADAETQGAAEASATEMKTGVTTQPLGATDTTALSESPVWRQIADTLTPQEASAESPAEGEASIPLPEALAATSYTGPSADYLARVDEYLEPRVAQYAALHPEMTLDEYKAAVSAHLQDLLSADGNVTSVRVPQDVLGSILDDGRLKSSVEVGKHGVLTEDKIVTYYNNQRVQYEEGAFGYAADAAATERPISGYITDAGADSSQAMSYGDARLVLTPEALQRATVTFGDSLEGDGSMVPRPLTGVRWDMYEFPASLNPTQDWADQVQTYYDMLPKYDPLNWRNLQDYGDLGSSIMGIRTDRYVESQFHGGVTVSDIREIVFTDLPPDPSVTRRLDEAGIKWRYDRSQNPWLRADVDESEATADTSADDYQEPF